MNDVIIMSLMNDVIIIIMSLMNDVRVMSLTSNVITMS